MPPSALAALNEGSADWTELQTVSDIVSSFGYNAGGKWVVSLTTHLRDYALRLHDSDALLRAVAAQAREYGVRHRTSNPAAPVSVYDDEPIVAIDGHITTRCATRFARLCKDHKIQIPL